MTEIGGGANFGKLFKGDVYALQCLTIPFERGIGDSMAHFIWSAKTELERVGVSPSIIATTSDHLCLTLPSRRYHAAVSRISGSSTKGMYEAAIGRGQESSARVVSHYCSNVGIGAIAIEFRDIAEVFVPKPKLFGTRPEILIRSRPLGPIRLFSYQTNYGDYFLMGMNKVSVRFWNDP